MSDSEENVNKWEGYPEDYGKESTDEDEPEPDNLSETKIKFLKEPEKLEVEEIKKLRESFIWSARMFFMKEIHDEGMLKKVKCTEETAKGLNTMLDILLKNSIDPM